MSQQTLQIFQQSCPVLAVLADTTRQQILCLLDEHGQLNVNQLTDLLHLSRPAVSHHLKLMLQNDLLAVKQLGKERFYSPNMQSVIGLLSALLASLQADQQARQAGTAMPIDMD